MRTHRQSLVVLALALASANTWAQPATADPAPKAGVPPTSPPAPAKSADAAGQEQPGLPAPRTSETVVAPPLTPATPGVAPIDTPTKATVGSSPSDSALRDSVMAAIGADPALEGARINVSVRDGVVNLSGTARDQAQAERAHAVVESIAGTARVNARISASG